MDNTKTAVELTDETITILDTVKQEQIVAYLNTFDDYTVIKGGNDEVALHLMESGYAVTHPLDAEHINIAFTGSIQDAELEEVITEAYAKHGHQLADLIRHL